MMVVVNSEPRQ